MYRTGDLARRLEDDAIEFLGRADRQIKLRGFRIECGEIEAQLRGQAGIKEAVVIARDGDTLTLRYRDYPKVPKFFRNRSGIALMASPAAS